LRLLLLAGALTGARLGDIATMRWADLDLTAGTWTFTPMKTSRTGKRLVLPLLSPLLDELRAAQAEALSPHVFPSELLLWQRADLTKVVSRHLEACGIATNEAVGEGQTRRKARVLVGFHSLRHTAATLAAKSGANLALVQKTLGHSTAGMTAHYTHADTASARQVLAPLAEIMNLPRSGIKAATA
jgi:integrase